MKFIAIAVIGENRGLGRDNKLLWSIPSDMKRFRSLTTGYPVIMGSKTFESIGKPLSGRFNIVMSVRGNFTGDCVFVARNKEEAVGIAKGFGKDRAYIIGGGEIYKLFFGIVSTLDLTIVNDKPTADVFFPEYELRFIKTEESELMRENGHEFKFTKWARR